MIKEDLKQLSTGEMLRISLARALYKNADVYIFDEPTSNIDKESVNGFILLIEKYCQESIVIIISHDDSVHNIFNKVIKI